MIEIIELSKIFKNGSGLKNVNVKFNPGEITAILGPNGAGKSTLLKLIFREYLKDEGKILYNTENESLKKFSFFTDQSLFPQNLTLNFFCMYSAELAGINYKEAKKRTKYLLKNLELEEYANKTFKQLSAGMQKKAMLAASLINDPEFIFFDEPTANLDIINRKEFINLLKIMKNQNKTIIITSHILDELQSLIDRLIILNDGIIVYDEKFDKNKENLEEIYFEKIKTSKVNFSKLTNWGE